MDKERRANVMIFVIGMMEELKDEGLLSGGYEMTEEGRRQYRQLVDSGFRPTDEEIDSYTKFIFQSAGTELASKMLS